MITNNTNKVTFKISFHEGKGDYCGNYETVEALNSALHKLGKQYAEGYTKTDVEIFMNGSSIFKIQIEPDIRGNETDLLEILQNWISWYAGAPCREYIGNESAQHYHEIYSWLLQTIRLWGVKP